MQQAKLFILSKADAFKAFIMVIIGSITSLVGDAVMQAITTRDYDFASIHWKAIGASVGVVAISYLQKQFLSNKDGQFLKPDKPAEEVKP